MAEKRRGAGAVEAGTASPNLLRQFQLLLTQAYRIKDDSEQLSGDGDDDKIERVEVVERAEQPAA
jgi:hypothetical protein